MSGNVKKVIGQTIQKNRKSLGLGQQELANLTGVSRSYVADIEAGRYAPSVSTLTKIASVLKMNLNFLLSMSEIQE